MSIEVEQIFSDEYQNEKLREVAQTVNQLVEMSLSRKFTEPDSVKQLSMSAVSSITNINEKMQIPSPYVVVGDAVVHPCVIYFKDKRFGYKYLMAYTPLPLNDSQYENPCVCGSDDLINWIPVGPQPIVQAPPAPSYNADPHIVLSNDGSKIYMMYRERGVLNKNNLMLMETSDLINWTSPVAIRSGNVGAQDYGSPSFWFNQAQQKWFCITGNLDAAGKPLQIISSTNSDIFSAWSSPVNVTCVNPNGTDWWHGFFTSPRQDGSVIGLIQDGGTAGGKLWWVESFDNGGTFVVSAPDSEGYDKNYRSCFFDTDNGMAMIRGRFAASLFLNLAALDSSGRRFKTLESVKTLANGGSSGDYLFVDNFTRADGTLGNGWAAYDANTFTIVGNSAENSSTSNCIAYNSLTRFIDGEVCAEVKTQGSSFWLRIRETNGNNAIRVGWDAQGSPLKVQEIFGGSLTNSVTLNRPMSDATVLSIRTYQNKLTVSLNGVDYYTYTIVNNHTGSRFGIQASGAVKTSITKFYAKKF
jgi:hypothetical protein